MKEIWKDIDGYDGLYQVSNFGRVKSLARKCERSNTGDYNVKEKILKPAISRRHCIVVLSKNGKTKTFALHRLVASAFIPNPNNLPMINHKDENPTNNNVDNLEWCTNLYNQNYGTLPLKRRHNNQVNPVVMCDLDGNEIKTFFSVSEAARTIKDINAVSVISKCCRNKRKSAYGYTWKYLCKE